MRLFLVAATVSFAIAAPAYAADAPAPSPRPSSQWTTKRAVTVHYPTLEKMLRRFSREAGAARTRG
jgi:hypothetical protein